MINTDPARKTLALPPTERQLVVHRFMFEFRAAHDMWPTIREIAEGLGIASTNAVNDHLLALQRKGLARRRPKCARGWVGIPQEGTTTDAP